MLLYTPCSFFFFFNDTATTEIYTLSLHDALPICDLVAEKLNLGYLNSLILFAGIISVIDRKSTRLNSSHSQISYAVFCLKKKKKHLYNLDSLIENQYTDTHAVIKTAINIYTYQCN